MRVADPPGVVTTTLATPAALAGDTAVMVVVLTMETPVATTPRKVTVADTAKLPPVIVTVVPPPVGPAVGDAVETDGGATYV